MNLLYVECNMGAAGDMLAAALYELCTDVQKQAFLDEMRALAPHGIEIVPQAVTMCGMAATHMSVSVHGCAEHAGQQAAATGCENHGGFLHGNHAHPHALAHEDAHACCKRASKGGHSQLCASHTHATPSHIAALLDTLTLAPAVRERAKAVYSRIAQAESRAHGVPVADIHFHEVGALDAVADVAAVCVLLHLLAPDAVVVSPIATGSGTVRCAHGILPVPAPATAFLLEGAPIWAGTEQGELCTPTGAALLQEIATSFGAMPPMTVAHIGCGAGTKQFATANLVRAFLGETTDFSFSGAAQHVGVPCGSASPNEELVSLACNLDDATAEEIGFALDALLRAGALDAYTTPIGMKKSRAGTLLTVLCRPADADALAVLLLQATPTLGVRRTCHTRYALARACATVDTVYGAIRVKTAQGYGVSKTKAEYDDVAAAAARTGASFAQVRAAVKAAT